MVLPKLRMLNLRGRLAQIRCGKGAAVMAPGVKRLSMVFSFKSADGHMGARKFWQIYMPSLQYHNPTVEMNVHRVREIGGPSTLTIEFDSDRKEVLDLKHKDKTDICARVLELTKATPVPTSESDNNILLEYDQFKKKLAVRTVNQKARRAAQKVAGKKMNISPLQ